MSIIERQITYQVKMTCIIRYEPRPGLTLEDSFWEAIEDIEVPEGGKNGAQFVDDTFTIIGVETLDGKKVNNRTGEIITKQ